jgi:hypothetical protein
MSSHYCEHINREVCRHLAIEAGKEHSLNANPTGAVVGGLIGTAFGGAGIVASTVLISTPLAPIAPHVTHLSISICAGAAAIGAKVGSHLEAQVKQLFN